MIPINAFASISFNGTSQYLGTSGFDTTVSGSKTLTMSAWVDIPAGAPSSTYVKIFGKTAGSANQTFNFGVQDCSYYGGTTGNLCMSMGLDNSVQNTYVVVGLSNSAVPLVGKNLLSIVWNNTTGTAAGDFKFYINGTAQSTSNNVLWTNVGSGYSSSTTLRDTSSGQFTLGSACGGSCPSGLFNGNISEIAVWTTALSSSNITTLYNGGTSSPCSRLPSTIGSVLIYFPLDDNSSGTVSSSPTSLGTLSFSFNNFAGSPSWSSDLECSASGTTWYVRDGGGNSSQCTGKTNAVYPGAGTGVACAFSNPGYALGYNCQNGGGSCSVAQKMASNDTLSILGDSDTSPGTQAQYYVGYGSPQMPSCSSGGASDCTMGQIPSGATIIGTGTHNPQIYAPTFPWEIFSIFSNNVTLTNLELATHQSCGYSSPDSTCSNGEGSNRTSDGILIAGSGYTFNNVYIHGFSRYGIVTQSMSGTNTFNNLRLISNAFAGFTLGNNDASANTGTLIFNSPIVEWSGCLEKYPLTTSSIDSPLDHTKCYGQLSNGFGDGLSFGPSGNTAAGNWTIKGPGSISFNMQDGFDSLHGNGTGTIQIDKMRFEGNAGNQVKINAQTGVVTNSIIIGDCGWWYNSSNIASNEMTNPLSDICRAEGNSISYFTTSGAGTVDTFYNNTIFGNGNVQILQNNTCDSTDILNVKNNIVYGGYYWGDDTTFNGTGGNSMIHYIYAAGTDGNGTGCSQSGQTLNEDYNVLYNMATDDKWCIGAHDICSSNPGFIQTMPMGTSGGGQSTYYSGTTGIQYTPITSGSVAKGAGNSSLSYWNNSNDYYNNIRPSPPSIGGLEYNSTAANGYLCFYNSDCSSNTCTNNVCTGSGGGGGTGAINCTINGSSAINGIF